MEEKIEASTTTPVPQAMNTDQAREYLVDFMMANFTDKTFHRYIRAQRETNLAGDFALQMATAVARLTSELELTRSECNSMLADAQAIADVFCIGWDARKNSSVVLENVRNSARFAEMLHMVEREFFMVPGEPDEDSPGEEPQDECLVNSWGSTAEQYLAQFRDALSTLAARSSPVPGQSTDLHATIMNLPCDVSAYWHDAGQKEAFKRGHLTARHAAAELVAAHGATAEQSSPVDLVAAVESVKKLREYIGNPGSVYHSYAANLGAIIAAARPAAPVQPDQRKALSANEVAVIRRAAEALEGLGYEDTAGYLIDIIEARAFSIQSIPPACRNQGGICACRSGGSFGGCAIERAAPAPTIQHAPAAAWQRITKPGQVKPGDKLRFTIGDEKYSETAKLILRPGTGEEEIIYNKSKNYYLITSMSIANKGSQKNVEFLSGTYKRPPSDDTKGGAL